MKERRQRSEHITTGSTHSAHEANEPENLARRSDREEGLPMPPLFDVENADAVTWLASLPSASVDLVITDPAYESLEKHRARGTTTRLKRSKASSNEWFTVFPNARFGALFAEVHRVLKKNAHFYLFCDQETMFVAKPLAEAAGFKFWKPVIWDKRRIGMGYHYRARYECILFFEKGKRALNSPGVADIIEVPRVINGYPTEKPVALAQVLVDNSSEPGEVVIDPFVGSGAFGVAALQGGRHFAGADVSLQACLIAQARLLDAGGCATPAILSNSNPSSQPRTSPPAGRGKAA